MTGNWELLTAMIAASDNNAANELVTRLGQEDFRGGSRCGERVL